MVILELFVKKEHHNITYGPQKQLVLIPARPKHLNHLIFRVYFAHSSKISTVTPNYFSIFIFGINPALKF